MKWTAYCVTCKEDLVSPLYGNNIHREPEMVENLARKHLDETFHHHVLMGVFVQKDLSIPQILYLREGNKDHDRT